MSSDCEHEWEFLQTLWEANKPVNTTATYFGSKEFAYFVCHGCDTVKKTVVVAQTEESKPE